MDVEKPKKRISGKYCVAGGPGNVSCTNNSRTEGVSMHMFPRKDAIRENRFVSCEEIEQTGSHRKHQCFVPCISMHQT